MEIGDQGSITQWISGIREGRSTAALQLWQRYVERLVRLARQKLRDVPRRAADEEDVVIDAFDSFCRCVRQGRFPRLADRDDLWQVLVMLTARKAADQRKYAQRQRRGLGRNRGESAFLGENGEPGGIDRIVGSEPTPEFAELVSEEFRRLLDVLDDETLRTVAIAKMEGYTNEEIAQRLDVKPRTIERKLHLIRALWSDESPVK